MYKIRNNVFETNSSSVHSLSVCSKKQYEEWKEKHLYFDEYNFLTKDEVIKEIQNDKYTDLSVDELLEMSEDDFDKEVCKENYYTFDKWYRLPCDTSFETFEEEYTTESGDEIVIFGCYGESH